MHPEPLNSHANPETFLDLNPITNPKPTTPNPQAFKPKPLKP